MNQSEFPIGLGWPEWLARLAETISEGLPQSAAAQFRAELLGAVVEGVDLQLVRAPFLIALQRRNLDRLQSNDAPYAEKCRNAIRAVIVWLESGSDDEESWLAAAAAAGQLALSARAAAMQSAAATRLVNVVVWSAEVAWSASRSADATRLATAAAWSAEWSAMSAASAEWSAAMSAWSAAQQSEYQTQRDDLLSLVRALATNGPHSRSQLATQNLARMNKEETP